MHFIEQSLIQNRYRLIQQLGRNGSRQTWLAKDERTEKLVALKALAFDLEMRWQDLKLFEREAVTLQNLKHPRIPQFVDSFWMDQQAEHRFCLVCSYIEGQSLGELAKSGKRWSLREVQDLAKAILEILDYLHRQSPPVIHRDIKPSNIIFGKDNQIYLIDFGAVQGQLGNGQTMTIVGTYGYMPPEQFYGQTTPASDLYSLGATLLTLLTGNDPSKWPREGTRIVFQKMPQFDPSFRSWLERLLESEPSNRFSTAQEALTILLNLKVYTEKKALPPSVYRSPQIDRFKPIPLSPSKTREIENPIGSRLKIFQDQEALQIIATSSMSRNLVNTVAAISFPAVISIVILSLAKFFDMGDSALVLLPILTMGLSLIFFAIISLLFPYSRFTLNQTRCILERSGLLGSWAVVGTEDFQSLLKLEYTMEKSSYTLWLVMVSGAREKLAGRLTLIECQWVVQVFEEWMQQKRELV